MLDVDRGVPADRRHRPRRLEELLARLDQVGRPGAHLLGIADQQGRARGQLVVQQRRLGRPQHRQQGLHAVDRDAVGELGQHFADGAGDPVVAGRKVDGKGRGPLAHVVGEQQLPTWHGDHRVELGLGDGALIGDGEHPELGYLVAPELGTDRMLGGRREHVEDAAAHRELAALADHVDARVRQLHQPNDHPLEASVEVDVRPDRQGDRLDVGEAWRHRLQKRTRRGDDDLQRRTQSCVVGIGQATQHQQPRSNRFHAW